MTTQQEELFAKARGLRVAFFDSDGVMFSNTVLMGAPFKAKERSYYDGQGTSLLRAVGVRVVFITNEKGDSAAAIRDTVAKLNSLASAQPQDPNGWEPVVLYEGRGGLKKLDTAREYLSEHGFTLDQASFMGDDLVDANLLREVGLPAAPAQAEEVIRKLCLERGGFVAMREGGAGAIRDFANMVLEARDIDPFTLPPQ